MGQVEGHRVVVGGSKFVAARLGLDASDLPAGLPGALTVAVGVDGELAGVLILADVLRAGTKARFSTTCARSASSASFWPLATATR